VLRFIESVVLFVEDIDAAAKWYASLFGSKVNYENEKYAFVQAPGVLYGFHPSDAKCPGGVGGTTVYWEVEDLEATVADLVARGAHLHRGPGKTSFGAGAAMLVCPFGCTIGLNRSTPESRAAVARLVQQATGAGAA
jgi:predicted enzyme related to lactoylglutathione lyase